MTAHALKRSILAAAAAALTLTGCGGGEGAGDARSAVESFVEARAQDDFEAECEMYADELKAELGAAENCPEILEEARLGSDSGGQISIVDVRERDGRAQAELDVPGERGATRITLLMEQREDAWRIIAFP